MQAPGDLPLAVGLTGANVSDPTTLEAMVDAVPPIRGKRGRPRRRPDKLHADKAYKSAANRAALRRTRYLGLARTHLAHVLTAVAINFLRLGEWFTEVPRARTRRPPYARLMADAPAV